MVEIVIQEDALTWKDSKPRKAASMDVISSLTDFGLETTLARAGCFSTGTTTPFNSNGENYPA